MSLQEGTGKWLSLDRESSTGLVAISVVLGPGGVTGSVCVLAGGEGEVAQPGPGAGDPQWRDRGHALPHGAQRAAGRPLRAALRSVPFALCNVEPPVMGFLDCFFLIFHIGVRVCVRVCVCLHMCVCMHACVISVHLFAQTCQL